MKSQDHRTLILCLACALVFESGCASVKKVFGVKQAAQREPYIENPFGTLSDRESSGPQPIVLRKKTGSSSFEVELPASKDGATEVVIPMSSQFSEVLANDGRAPASTNESSQYMDRKPSATDRQIVMNFPKGNPEDSRNRNEIEEGLHLQPSDDDIPEADTSYLASIDHLKQLFKSARYEAGLLEIDDLLKTYPTDSKLYEMRGTLLDRLGYEDMAMQSWKQALQIDPKNLLLKKFVDQKDRKRRLRGVASP